MPEASPLAMTCIKIIEQYLRVHPQNIIKQNLDTIVEHNLEIKKKEKENI